jgi:predicted secreted hydrolase
VTGTITLENTTMNVTGTGYHDHNWDVGAAVALHFGWFWGTFESSSHSVTWAVVYPTRLTQHPMIVVNEKNGGYLNIPPETIWFSAQNKQVDHFRLIPRFLNIETMTEKVFLVVNMEVLSVDHARFVGFINYWRYHVKCTGSIMMNGHMETIDGVFIAEYLRFR